MRDKKKFYYLRGLLPYEMLVFKDKNLSIVAIHVSIDFNKQLGQTTQNQKYEKHQAETWEQRNK